MTIAPPVRKHAAPINQLENGNFLERRKALGTIAAGLEETPEGQRGFLFEKITGRFEDKNAEMRRLAVTTVDEHIGLLPEDQRFAVAVKLFQMLGDKNEDVREDAAGAASTVIDYMPRSRIPDAITALGNQQSDGDLSLETSISKLTVHAVKRLPKDEIPSAMPHLLKNLDNRDADLRRISVRAAAALLPMLPEDAQAIMQGKLMERLDDSDDKVSGEAFNSLLKTSTDLEKLADLVGRLFAHKQYTQQAFSSHAQNIRDLVNARGARDRFAPIDKPYLKVGERMGSAKMIPLTFRPQGTKEGPAWHQIRCQFRDTAGMTERVNETYPGRNEKHRRSYMAFLEVKEEPGLLRAAGNWLNDNLNIFRRRPGRNEQV